MKSLYKIVIYYDNGSTENIYTDDTDLQSGVNLYDELGQPLNQKAVFNLTFIPKYVIECLNPKTEVKEEEVPYNTVSIGDFNLYIEK